MFVLFDMNYKIPSPKEIREKYQKSEYSFIEYHFHRRISPYFTWFFLHVTLTAELIALLTPLTDLLTLFLIYRGNFILAAIFTQIHIILDSSDGEIARFRKTLVKRSKKEEAWGAFTDSLVGMILFPFVVFYTALILGDLITASIAIGAFYLLVITSAYTKVYYPGSKVGKNFREKMLGKRKYKWGFNSIIQKSLITLTLLFQAIIFLWIFVAGALAITLLRIRLLYKQNNKD